MLSSISNVSEVFSLNNCQELARKKKYKVTLERMKLFRMKLVNLLDKKSFIFRLFAANLL